MRYRLNAPDVMQETIDGEVIIVHVVTGAYYSLVGSGATIWRELLRGRDQSAILDRFVLENDPLRGTVAAEVDAFVAALLDERLVEHRAEDSPEGAVDDGHGEGTAAYAAPSLQKYTDMEELLLVDPIHEVDPSGWPAKPKGTT